MIGVIARQADHDVVAEFFELFKTPWEFYRFGSEYSAVLCDGCEVPKGTEAPLVVSYASFRLPGEAARPVEEYAPNDVGRLIRWNEDELPVYRGCLSFPISSQPLLQDRETRCCVGFVREGHSGTHVRIGYGLFDEVRHLLSAGQPQIHASIPTLDLHIALLRELMLASGVAFTEIPPVPEGYKFIACLTHDVDHPSVKLHGFDHTIMGFLLRATIGSLLNVARRRISWKQAYRNWLAVLKLPLVHLGLAADFWRTFDRFVCLEEGNPSTFFFVPYGGKPGQLDGVSAPRKRATAYGIADVADVVRNLEAAGCEIGLHGLDAWHDVDKARAEFDEIRSVSGGQELGVRMHWLYWNEDAPAVLEAAGAVYDSTVGYNGEVGYRAGTAQVYKPLNTKQMLELPLIVMDTALFFPSHLNLSPSEARTRVAKIIDNAQRHGGCVTINWHDRSIAPERLWDEFYRELIEELLGNGAWVASASAVVSWFQTRRSSNFEQGQVASGIRSEWREFGGSSTLPGLQVRKHSPVEFAPIASTLRPPSAAAESIGYQSF